MRNEIMTPKEYVLFYNLNIKFRKNLKMYLEKFVLKEGEVIDPRPITFCFCQRVSEDKMFIRIQYYLKKENPEDEISDAECVDIPLAEFEKKLLGREIDFV